MDDDFFDLGGHSLNGAQVLNRIQSELNVTLTIDDLLENGTINQLADYIRANHLISSLPKQDVPTRDIFAVEEQQHYALSPAQNGFWYHNQFAEGSAAYIMNAVYEVEGDLDKECLLGSIQVLAERHESLRTIFTIVEGQPRQVIIPAEEFQPQSRFEDLRGHYHSSMRLLDLAVDAKLFFDLSKPPYLFKIQHLADKKFLFSLAIHHVLSDGWSFRILFSELIEIYNARKLKTEPTLQPLIIQYKDFSAWINSKVQNGLLMKERAYWQSKLNGPLATRAFFPDKGENSRKTFRGVRFDFAVPSEYSEQLKKLAAEHNVTTFIIVLAIWKLIFYKSTRQEDSILTTTISGRSHKLLEPLLGIFVNTLILRDHVDANESFIDFLLKVKATTLEAYDNQLYPFEQIINDLRLDRGDDQKALSNVNLVWHSYNPENDRESENGKHDLKFTAVDKDGDGLLFDILINGSEHFRGFSIEYDTDRFFSESIEKLADNFNAISGLILRDPSRSIHDVIEESLTAKEKMLVNAIGENSMISITDDFSFLENH